MEELIKQAFMHVDVIGPHVHEGHYDLVGPDGEIILPQIWETMIQPDWAITMHMWPMPEPPPPPPPAPEQPKPMDPPPPPMPEHWAMMPGPHGMKPPKVSKDKKKVKRSSLQAHEMHGYHMAPMAPMPQQMQQPMAPPPPPPPPAGIEIIEVMGGGGGGMPPPPPAMVVVGEQPRPRRKEVRPSAFARWAAGGASRSQSLKRVKKA